MKWCGVEEERCGYTDWIGTFKVGQRKARKGRNPQTGAEIRISAKKVPRFVPGKALKGAVSKSVFRWVV